ncbi:unnamed protein product [Heligmosomoides polygyrus]|uniref:DNA-directed DNA polymerase n=1 Tax=Heligmosomoides polygyrus TaxID=6339 RepID=A0A183GBY8_HELPZ|nr:unnamed protein product [Heligmosomoides polygyrus]
MSERLRQLKCPYEDYDLATMDSEGYMYVHPHFSRYPNITEGVKCKVVFIEGGLRKNGTNTGDTTFTEVAEEEAPENTRFYANADAFYIRCYKASKMVFEKAYAGIRDFSRKKNKVGDNSMVNLEPILAGDIMEALVNSKDESSGDINPQWILPTNNPLDPTLLPFLWKTMKEKFGCTSMFNDDIAVPQRGIFHYPENEFKSGFTSPPSDHYYRAYYLAVYKVHLAFEKRLKLFLGWQDAYIFIQIHLTTFSRLVTVPFSCYYNRYNRGCWLVSQSSRSLSAPCRKYYPSLSRQHKVSLIP